MGGDCGPPAAGEKRETAVQSSSKQPHTPLQTHASQSLTGAVLCSRHGGGIRHVASVLSTQLRWIFNYVLTELTVTPRPKEPPVLSRPKAFCLRAIPPRQSGLSPLNPVFFSPSLETKRAASTLRAMIRCPPRLPRRRAAGGHVGRALFRRSLQARAEARGGRGGRNSRGRGLRGRAEDATGADTGVPDVGRGCACSPAARRAGVGAGSAIPGQGGGGAGLLGPGGCSCCRDIRPHGCPRQGNTGPCHLESVRDSSPVSPQ